MRCSSARPPPALARGRELDEALLSAYRPGDQLVVTEVDRLDRRLSILSSYPSSSRRN